MKQSFNHFNEQGEALMVDVSQKAETERVAIAKGKIKVNADVWQQIKQQSLKKGDVLGVARLAGILAVKKTSDLIPLCHPLIISQCAIDFELSEAQHEIEVSCTVKVNQRTGVEMEALTGVNITLLTIYDMCKAVDKYMKLTDIRLVYKSGGQSGEWTNGE